MENKSIALKDCELKFASDDQGTFSGYGAIFNNLDFKNDIIMPGAFADVLKSGDPVDLYVNHGWIRGELPVGRWSNLVEDTKGLLGDASVVMQMPSAQDAYWSVKGGLVKGLSIGYKVHPQGFDIKSNGNRVIHRMQYLKEISITTDPANEKVQILSVKFKQDLESAQTERDIEQLLRETGLGNWESKAVVSRARDILLGRETQQDIEAKNMAAILDRLKKIG
jgi:HK97 family phage prohead protease